MNYGESRKPQGICEGAAWLSSARAVRCRLKCHNERNPCCQLLTGSAEDSDKTAIVRCEEGGDDVKSARPLRPGLHTCYNGGYRGPLPREWMPIPKTSLSSDWSLQPDSTKLDSLVIAHQPRRGEYVPALYTPPVKPWEPGVPEVRNREERPRVKLVTGAKS